MNLFTECIDLDFGSFLKDMCQKDSLGHRKNCLENEFKTNRIYLDCK